MREEQTNKEVEIQFPTLLQTHIQDEFKPVSIQQKGQDKVYTASFSFQDRPLCVPKDCYLPSHPQHTTSVHS